MKVPELWYEDADGKRWYPPETGAIEPPAGYRYQHSRFLAEVHHTILDCAGGHSKRLADSTTTFFPVLVLALVRPSLRERLWQILRYGRRCPRLTYRAAVRVAIGCERCINAWSHRAGLPWGYRKGSAAWLEAGTRCDLCEPPLVD